MNHKKLLKNNGYVMLISEETGNYNNDRVYEHIVIGEEVIGRKLKENEVVHHLDTNKENNSPDNLLVLEDSQHTKLHNWLNNNILIPKPAYAIRMARGCLRCAYCNKPITPEQNKFCSRDCVYSYNKVVMSKETPIDKLTELVKNLPMTKVGKLLGMSDNGVRRRCNALGVAIPKKHK